MSPLKQVPFVQGVALNAYLSAEKGIVKAKHSGCAFWYIDSSIETETLETWTDERIARLRGLIADLEVKPIFHGNYRAPLASDIDTVRQSAIEYIYKEVDICARIGAPLIVHGSVIVEPRLVVQAKAAALDRYVDSVQKIVAYAKTKGVEIWLENLSNYTRYRPFHYIYTTPKEYRYVLERVPGAKFIFDVGHANVDNPDPLEGFKELAPRIVGMSLSNNAGQRDDHLPLEHGTINYKRLVSEIVETGWSGVIAFETRGRDPDKSLEDLVAIYEQVLDEQAAESLVADLC